MKKIIVIAGASGSGKDTLVNTLLKTYSIEKLISTTTRKIRKGEIDGIDYNFISKELFENEIKKNNFLEYVEYNGNFYGKRKSDVKKIFREKKDIITVMEKEGIKTMLDSKKFLKQNNYKLIIIFLYISEYTIKQRMIKRGDDIKQIQKRINNLDFEYFQEIQNYADYIINADNSIHFVYKEAKKILLLNT